MAIGGMTRGQEKYLRTVQRLAAEAAEEVAEKRGRRVADEFRKKLENELFLVGWKGLGGAISGAMGIGTLIGGPIGTVGGAVLGGYLAVQRAKTKIENLKYRYLYQ